MAQAALFLGITAAWCMRRNVVGYFPVIATFMTPSSLFSKM